MNASFISTVFNEEKSIRKFIESILNQTKKPNEIIIVDAGSSDRTYEILKEISKKNKLIKVFQDHGANRSKGRNLAISKAKGEIILTSDAGCIVDKTWVENMLHHFPKQDFVAGGSKAIIKNNFDFFQAFLTIKKINNFARMSARNTAFKKKCWIDAGGYPEKSNTGEDHRFHINVVERGYRIKIDPKKLVAWEMRPNFKSFFRQFYGYGKGDREQKNFSKKSLWKNVLMIFFFWIYVFLFFFSFFISSKLSLILISIPTLFLFIASFYIFIKTKKLSAFFYAPLLIILKRTGYIFGATFK